ncbi:hypothetical protein ACFQ12_12485 [Methylobacterium trifolii]
MGFIGSMGFMGFIGSIVSRSSRFSKTGRRGSAGSVAWATSFRTAGAKAHAVANGARLHGGSNRLSILPAMQVGIANRRTIAP